MIANPLVTKELVSVLRSRGAAVLAALFVGALCVLAFAMWPEAGINPAGTMYSRLFFTVLLVAQLVMLALFSPPFSATSITYERETNTWEMLYYSNLRPDHILVGKLAGAAAFLLVLVAISLPVGGACFLLGGVSVREMFLAYLVLVVAGITFGLLGLAWSGLMKSSFSALIATYISLLVLCGAVYMPMLLLPNWKAGQPAMHAIRCMSPFTALVAITKDEFRRSPGGSEGAVARYFVYTFILVVILAAVVLWKIMVRPKPKVARRDKVIDETTPLLVRMARRIFFVIDPRRRRRSIGTWTNPILILDLRTRTSGVANLMRAAFACLIFALGLVILVSGTFGATRPDTMRLLALSFQIGLVALIGPSLTIGAIASEVEGRTFDLLRMTPLRSWVIFSGKFGAAALLAALLVIASAPVFVALQYIQAVNEQNVIKAIFAQPEQLVAMFSITCVTIVLALSVGLFFSSVCATTARAGAWAYGVMALVTVGTLLGLILRERLGEKVSHFIVAFNPIVTAVATVSEDFFPSFGAWRNTLWSLGILSILFILATVYRLHHAAGPEK